MVYCLKLKVSIVEHLNQNNSFKYPVHSVRFAFSLIEILARDKMEYSIIELIKES